MRIVIAGGGASGVFAALQCRKTNSSALITIVEKSDRLLTKVRMSGGGRCNLSHASVDVQELLKSYPRGYQFLRTAFNRFGPRETVDWFKNHDVPVKMEPDGRIFPASNRSQTVVDCLLGELGSSGVTIRFGNGVQSIRTSAETGMFTCMLDDGSTLECERLCIAAGGDWDGRDTSLLTDLGHSIVPPVPSLFTFVISDSRLAGIPGVSVDDVSVAIPKTRFSERGALLVTHRGISGPAVLLLSSRAARFLCECAYRTGLSVDWCPSFPHQKLLDRIKALRTAEARSYIFAHAALPLPARLWQSLCTAAGCTEAQRWADLTKREAHDLAGQLHKSVFATAGMDLNKKEFVTCGGVALGEIDPFTMQSRRCKNLFFAGEVMDIDGITGGYNLQAAWTTGWIAGTEMGK